MKLQRGMIVHVGIRQVYAVPHAAAVHDNAHDDILPGLQSKLRRPKQQWPHKSLVQSQTSIGIVCWMDD